MVAYSTEYQGLSWQIQVQVIVNYRIILAAPVRFHITGSALVVKERCRAEGEIENAIVSKLIFSFMLQQVGVAILYDPFRDHVSMRDLLTKFIELYVKVKK